MFRGFLRAGRVGLLLSALIGLFFCAITLVYTLPNDRVLSSVWDSIELLEKETTYPQPFQTYGLRLDNFTDAVMLDVAIADPDRSVLTNAMRGARQSGPPPHGTISGLKKSAGGNVDAKWAYARYWHGYQVALRPLLVFFNYGSVRYINMLVLAALSIVVAVTIRRTLGWGSLVAFLTALALAGFYVVPMSLQFSAVAYLMLLSTLGALELERRGMLQAVSWEYFAAIGALTSFFDLLTTPLLTVGMPIVAVLLFRTRGRSLEVLSGAAFSVGALVWWCVGFAATWAAKWFIASPILKSDVVSEAVESMVIRTGGAEAGRPVAEAWFLNTRQLFPLLPTGAERTSSAGAATTYLLIIFTLLVVALSIWAMRRHALAAGVDMRSLLKRRLVVLALVPLPYIWLTVLSQHSVIHFWFTYRILAISVFAALAIGLTVFDSEVPQE